MKVWLTACFVLTMTLNAASVLAQEGQFDLEETKMVSEDSGVTKAAQELEVQADDVTLYVRIAGDPKSGNVLIANHGGPGLTSHYMLSLERLAGTEFAVVTYDQRGTGRSTMPPDGYGLLNYVADLEAVRKVVGVEKAHILGHSWGGLVAMRYATVHPQKVRSIILMSSGPPNWQAMQMAQANLGQRIAELQRQGIIPEELPTTIRERMEAIGLAYYADPRFKLPDELMNTFLSLDPDKFETVNRLTWSAMGNYDFTAEVAGLNHPVLMLCGANDPFGLSMAETTRTALSAARVEFVMLEGCGHFWQECPDEFLTHVRAFLELPSAKQTKKGEINITSEESNYLEADTLVRFEALLGNLREELKIPAISAAIVRDQEIVWTKGFGYADLENQIEATEHTPYHLASLTKTFASTIIMQLVKDGKIDLNDPITKYGIELESEGIIRVKHLLTHTSEGVPGERYNYSGGRFGYLTQVVEKASGRSFTELLIENILEPLGMSETAPNVAVMEQTKPLPAATEEEQEVIAAAEGLLGAYGRGDADTIVQYLSPENTDFDSDGELLGKFTDERSLRMAFAAGYRIDFDVQRLRAEVYGEAAVTIGYILGSITEPGGAKREVRWRSSMFWAKQEGRWYVIHSHESPLKATLISISDDNRQRFQKVHGKLAKPYALDESHNIVRSEYPPGFGVSAGLIASVMDMAKYDIAIDGNAFLDKETQDYVFTPTVSTKGETLPYGLGWFVQEYRGTKFVWHYGYWIGNSSLILKVPEYNMTFIVFANTDNLSRPFRLGDGDVMNSIMALAFLKTFIFPQKYQEILPEINWKAEENGLKAQLKQIEGKDYKEIYAKELTARARMLSSVGKEEAADRLHKIHGEFFSGYNDRI